MRKIYIILGLLISFNALAATQLPYNLSAAIIAVTQKPERIKIIPTSLPMIYGGQDIYRSKTAIADETIWVAQRTLIG